MQRRTVQQNLHRSQRVTPGPWDGAVLVAAFLWWFAIDGLEYLDGSWIWKGWAVLGICYLLWTRLQLSWLMQAWNQRVEVDIYAAVNQGPPAVAVLELGTGRVLTGMAVPVRGGGCVFFPYGKSERQIPPRMIQSIDRSKGLDLSVDWYGSTAMLTITPNPWGVDAWDGLRDGSAAETGD